MQRKTRQNKTIQNNTSRDETRREEKRRPERQDKTKQSKPKQDTTRRNENTIEKKTPNTRHKMLHQPRGERFSHHFVEHQKNALHGAGEALLATILLSLVPKRVPLKCSTSPVESVFLIMFLTVRKILSTGLVKHFLLLFC